MICDIGVHTDSSKGNSDDPLLKADANKQVGTVSWGIGCNNDIPGVYTNAGLYCQWIYQHLGAYSGDNIPTINEHGEDGNDVFKLLQPTSAGNRNNKIICNILIIVNVLTLNALFVVQVVLILSRLSRVK